MPYLSPNHTIDSVQWAQHITEPFSESSLGAEKPYVTVEGLIFPDALCRFDDPAEDWGIHSRIGKYQDVAAFGLQCASTACTKRRQEEGCQESDLASPLHLAFQGVARQILGQKAYTAASVEVYLWRRPVRANTGQTAWWHLDTFQHPLEIRDEKTLMGIMTDELPTQVLFNPTHPDDYVDGDLVSINGAPLTEVELDIRTLRPNTLTVLPMNIPHIGQVASTDISCRHFARWHAAISDRALAATF